MPLGVEHIDIVEFNNDQRREFVNARQRFSAWKVADEHARSFRGSLVWHNVRGREYLVRAYYDAAGIRVESKPPWKPPARAMSKREDDLEAVSIAGLVWLQNSPPFESVAIDEKGAPVRVVTNDPRIFATHKLWRSVQPNRDPLKRARDRAQARAVAHIVSRFLPQLPYVASELRMIPRDSFEAAKPLFET